MIKCKKVIALLLSLILALGVFAVAGSAVEWDDDGNLIVSGDETISVEVHYFTSDGTALEDGGKVTPGDTVKVRVYIGVNYYTSAGALVLKVDNDFFDASGIVNGTVLTTNSDTEAVASHGLIAKVYNSSSAYEDDDHTTLSIALTVDDDDMFLYQYDISEWLFELDLPVIATFDSANDGVGQVAADPTEVRTEDNLGGNTAFFYGEADDIVSDLADSYMFNPAVNFDADTLTVNNAVTFDPDYDGATATTVSGVIGTAQTIPTYTRSGYTFKGWNDGDGNLAFSATDTTFTMPIDDDVVYTAVWQKNVTIKFENTGDTTIADITDVEGGTEWTNPPADPTWDGYKFMGWEDEEGNLLSKLPDYYPVATEEKDEYTYTAIWEKYITITFDANGGTFSDGNAGTYSGASIYGGAAWVTSAVPTYNVSGYAANGITRAGYILLGWSVNGGSTITTFPEEYPDDDVTYTAVWHARNISVRYIIDGEIADAFTVSYGDGTYTVATVEGVTSWTNGGTVYAAGDTYTFAATDIDSVVEFTGTSEVATHTATFVVDGETVETADYAENATITAPADPAKEGYTFTGWSPTVGTMGTENITFTATFEANEYTVTYKDDDGTEIETFTVSYGEELEIVPDPEKDGWTFVKFEDEDGKEPSAYATMPAKNLTFTAVYTQDAVNVTYYAYGTDSTKADAYSQLGEVQVVAIGASLATYTAPAYDGWTFSHWEDENGVTHADGETVSAALNLYAVYEEVIPVKLVPKDENSTAMIERDGVVETYNTDLSATPVGVTEIKEANETDTYEADGYDAYYVYGLKTNITVDDIADYVRVTGDGRYEIELNSTGKAGTGAIIAVYDKNGTEDQSDDVLVEQFYIIIFGDIDGDTDISTNDTSRLNTEIRTRDWSGDSKIKYLVKAADLDLDTDISTNDLARLNSAIRLTIEIDQKTGLAS